MFFLQRKSRRPSVRLLGVCVCVVLVVVAGRYVLPWCSVYRARAALIRHDADRAMSWLKCAWAVDDGNAEAYFLAARASRRLGDGAGLQKYLERARDLGWPATLLQREWTLAQAQIGLLQQAEPHLQRLLVNPGEDGAEICAAFASGFAHHYQFQRAFMLLDVWEKDFPDDPEPHVMRGTIQKRWHNWAGAESEFGEALKRQPSHFEARTGLAEVLTKQHKYDQALQHYRVNLKVDPDNYDLLTGWAECLTNQGRLDEASDVYRRLLAQNEDDCTARLGLGRMHLNDNRLDEALALLESCAASCPRRPDVRYVLAQALVAAGRREEAKPHFRYFDEANTALLRVTTLTGHLVQHPDDLEARFEVGKLYIDYGSPEEGANWLKTVLAIAPNHQRTHAVLAEYYEQAGQAELARDHRSHLAQSERDGGGSSLPHSPSTVTPVTTEGLSDAQR